MAADGVAMRTLQEWMGHRDFKTTLTYADYAPMADEVERVNRVFGAKSVQHTAESGGVIISAAGGIRNRLDGLAARHFTVFRGRELV